MLVKVSPTTLNKLSFIEIENYNNARKIKYNHEEINCLIYKNFVWELTYNGIILIPSLLLSFFSTNEEAAAAPTVGVEGLRSPSLPSQR